MNPSYNGSFGGTNSGGMNPGVGGATPVGGAQPMGDVQSVGSVQPTGGQPTMPAQQSVTPQTPTPMQATSQPVMTQQPMIMSQPVMPQMPMDMGSGDIILAGNEKKKMKKSTIALIAGVVLLAVVGVGIVIARLIGGGGSGGSTDVQSAFNRYANYFLSGEQNDNPVEGTLKNLEETAFGRDLENETDENESKDSDYYRKLREYYNVFYDAYANLNGDSKSDDLNVISGYKDKLDLVVNYYNGHILDRSDLLNVYLSSGEEGAEQLIVGTFEVYKNIGNLYGVNYYDLVVRGAEIDLEIIAKYNSAGCIVDDQINYGCAITDNTIDEKEIEYTNNYYERRAIIENSISDLYFGIIDIRRIVYSEGDNLIDGDENEN